MKPRIVDKVSNIFFSFAKQIGYFQHLVDSNSSYTSLYAIRDHGLKVYIDWRDFYLEMFVVRMVGKEPPSHNLDPITNRILCVPIYYIYQTEYSNYQSVNDRNLDNLINTLNTIIALIQRDPKILHDYIENIEENTSEEKTKDFRRSNIKRSVRELELKYSEKKVDEQTYSILKTNLMRALNKI